MSVVRSGRGSMSKRACSGRRAGELAGPPPVERCLRLVADLFAGQELDVGDHISGGRGVRFGVRNVHWVHVAGSVSDGAREVMSVIGLGARCARMRVARARTRRVARRNRVVHVRYDVPRDGTCRRMGMSTGQNRRQRADGVAVVAAIAAVDRGRIDVMRVCTILEVGKRSANRPGQCSVSRQSNDCTPLCIDQRIPTLGTGFEVERHHCALGDTGAAVSTSVALGALRALA